MCVVYIYICSIPVDPGLGYDSSDDPLLSQSSGGSLEPSALETSVDGDLTDDDEYIGQVSGRVFSPPPGEHYMSTYSLAI